MRINNSCTGSGKPKGKMKTLLGESKLFHAEMQRLIDRCNIRLKKAFDIRRFYQKKTDLTYFEIDTIERCTRFIRRELKQRKELQKRLNKYEFVNN